MDPNSFSRHIPPTGSHRGRGRGSAAQQQSQQQDNRGFHGFCGFPHLSAHQRGHFNSNSHRRGRGNPLTQESRRGIHSDQSSQGGHTGVSTLDNVGAPPPNPWSAQSRIANPPIYSHGYQQRHHSSHYRESSLSNMALNSIPPHVIQPSVIQPIGAGLPAYAPTLASLVVPFDLLEENDYKTKDFTEEEMLGKRRCAKCNRPWSKVQKAQESELKRQAIVGLQRQKSETQLHSEGMSAEDEEDVISIQALTPGEVSTESTEGKQKETVLLCRFHPGNIMPSQKQSSMLPVSGSVPNARPSKIWSCCNDIPTAKPCSGAMLHTFDEMDSAALAEQFQYCPTPPVTPLYGTSYRSAVALDCEMGVNTTGELELIRLTLVDYYTSEVLIDKLVFPSVKMRHLNTRYSGVTWNMLNEAWNRGKSIRGRAAALYEVWKFVSPETIVVAHSGNHDLHSLRWRHHKVIDTYLLACVPVQRREKEQREKAKQSKALEAESKAPIATTSEKDQESEQPTEPESTPATTKQDGEQSDSKESSSKVKEYGPFSLKTQTKKYLGRDIQTGTKGHDSKEDAFASRDLAHWHVQRKLECQGPASDYEWLTE